MTTYPHDELLAALSAAVNRDDLCSRRTVRLALVSIAVVLLAGAAIAAATVPPWWQNAAPPVNPQVVNQQLAPTIGSDFPPTADRSRARTVSELDGATLVAAPVGKNGYCLIPALPGNPDLGFSCGYQLSDEVRTYALPASKGAPRWIIYGRFTNLDAAMVDMSAAVGQRLQVKLQPGGFFIADIPSSRWQALDGQAGPATVLDDTGKTLANVCLDFGPSPNSPEAGQTRFPSMLGSPPCKAPVQIQVKPDVSKATELVQATLTNDFNTLKAGTTIALWRAPDQGGGWCLLFGPLASGPSSQAGGECGSSVGATQPGHPINVSSSSVLAHGIYEHLVQGFVDPTSGIVKVELQTANGSYPLAFTNGWFLGDLGPTGSVDVDDAYVIGYDKAGNEVARAAAWPHA
jgi:hypothetical protein